MNRYEFSTVTGSTILLGTLFVLAGCNRADGRSDGTKEPDVHSATADEASRAAPSAPASPAPAVDVGGLATCQPTEGVRGAVRRMVDVADADGDGKISKDEAYSAADFLVGGFFFRADQNADGSITPEEGRAARKEVMTRYPELAAVLRESDQQNGKRPLASIASSLDVEYGKPVTAVELRGAAHQAVDELYGSADRNHDGALTLAEARSASMAAAERVGNVAFQAADRNGDGKLNLEEFRSALDAPTALAFRLSDTNNDGALSKPEASRASLQVARRIGVPLDANTTKATQQQQ